VSRARVKLRADALEWTELEGEIVALDLRTSRYLAVNRTGAAIWSLLVEGATEAELAARVSDRFEVPAQTAEGDVRTFLDQLTERDLLER
jgi:Coenzyme PQQ synthesis protein D (PqqD)